MRLASRGLLILVDNAEPDRLRELLVALLPEHPDLVVETDVQAVYTVPEGSVLVLVLVPHIRHAEWLNQQRPVFARRELKVILWCDRMTTEMLRTQAVDFFDWISHVHECPPGYASPIDASPTLSSIPELVRTTEAGDLDVAERSAIHALQATETEQWRGTPERAKALHAMGRIDVRRGRFRDAETNFRAALAIMGDETPQLHVDLADVLIRQGRHAEALPIAQHAVSTLRVDGENARRSLLEEAVKLVARIEKLVHYTRPIL